VITEHEKGEDLLRKLAPQVLARLVRAYGAAQFDACEDAVQDALLAAHRQWQHTSPADPLAWLVRVARRRYVDAVRADSRRRERERREALLGAPLTIVADSASEADDSLFVLQLCCHPALSRSAQVALTLRAAAGLSTAQIANIYQLPRETIAQRITRAKRQLRDFDRVFPRPRSLSERLDPVLEVLYAMLTEAHLTTTGAPALDTDLADEAIHLARLIHKALPSHTEVAGLLALMLLTESRGPARQAPDGSLIPLDEQDRRLWNRDLADEGLALVDAASRGATPGPFLLQACIAAIHAQAADTATTDWGEILALYDVLDIVTDRRNPTIALNRVVAVAQVHGDAAALAALECLANTSPRLPRLAAVRAHLLGRLGRDADAVEAYRQAARSTMNLAEREYLRKRLAFHRTRAAD
jgi:RNA polymerase sigma factor (sigma-70 family)